MAALIGDGIQSGNDDPRDHYYVVRCVQCPKWVTHCPQAPIKAERLAHRHARNKAGHSAYVTDLNALEVKHRYQFDPITGSLDPNDPPPF